jgi:C_GCAxxG_C_C family probable redox protein
MSNVDSAVFCFKEGFACSQALVSIYGVPLGLDRKNALKISGVFRGGMAHMGETCGAVTGAFMVIGLKYGNIEVDDEKAKEMTNKLAREFVDKFKALNGSILCRELIGCDISTPEGMKLAKERRLFETVCPNFVRSAAEIIEEVV